MLSQLYFFQHRVHYVCCHASYFMCRHYLSWQHIWHFNIFPFIYLFIIAYDKKLVSYTLRQDNGKHFVVKGFQSMNFTVIATGDSYNDIAMLKQADKSILFNPPKKVIKDYPEFEIANNYKELKGFFEKQAK